MLPRQRVKTVTHAVELLNFVQNCIRVHEICGFPEEPRDKRTSDGPTCVGKTQKGFAVYLQVRNPHERHQDALSVHLVFGLAAPTRVSPAPAAEQKQNQQNNQYGFHVVPHL